MTSIFLCILFFTLSSIPKVTSAKNTTDLETWVVYDSEVDDSTLSNHLQPSCILAEMKAKIDIFGSILPSTSYNLFPNGTQVELAGN